MNHRILIAPLVCIPAAGFAADSLSLTLPEAVQMALAHNRTLKIARLKVREKEQKKAAARAEYFPRLTNESSVLHTTALENIEIPRGAFGVVPNAGPVPAVDILIDQGNQTFETIGTGLTEPLTPLIRIHEQNRIAASEVEASRDDLKSAENEIALKVHQLYYGILIAHLEKQAAEQDNVYASTRLRESQQGVREGSALNVDVLDSQAGLLQNEQAMLSLDLSLSDLNTQLDDLLGLPLGTTLVLSPVEVTIPAEIPRDQMLQLAYSGNPQIASAMQVVEQSKAAVTAAKSAYIPDISIFARQSYQNGVPFLVRNFGTFGIAMRYDVYDFGKRRAEVREREAQLAEAQENVEQLREAVGVQIEQGVNKVERTGKMLRVASEVVRLRAESERVAGNQLKEGAILISARRQATAASYKAKAELLQAQLAYLLAQAELEQTLGRTPGQ